MGEDCFWWQYASPLGLLTIAERRGSLVGLWMQGQRYHPQPGQIQDTPVLLDTCRWLDAYFAGGQPEPTSLPLAPEGTSFRQAVWKRMLEIPYGSTATYAQLAAQIAAQRGLPRMSAQAVGGAVGHNPISIIIPCHRVLGSDGSLTGYAGGVERKQWLLEWEHLG